MKRYWQYLKYVLRHKWFVFQECRKLGVPLWVAIFHDWDKFLPDEFIPYARCFYAPDGTKQYKEDSAFAHAWMLHQHRNKHHWQYWLTLDRPLNGAHTAWEYNIPLREQGILVWDRGEAQQFAYREADGTYKFYNVDVLTSILAELKPLPMPELYMREMLADWRGAGKAITGKDNTLSWYIDNYYKIKLHDRTREWLDYELTGFAFPLHVIAQSNNCDVHQLKDQFIASAAKLRSVDNAT